MGCTPSRDIVVERLSQTNLELTKELARHSAEVASLRDDLTRETSALQSGLKAELQSLRSSMKRSSMKQEQQSVKLPPVSTSLAECSVSPPSKPKIGMLGLDGAKWRPAFQNTTSTFPYATVIATVRGLSYEQARVGKKLTAVQAQAVRNAVKQLERNGVIAITADSGCWFHYQQLVTSCTSLPVALSALLQVL